MKLLDRYVLREIAAPTAVAFAVYTGFMLIRGLIQFSDLVLQSGDPVRQTGLVLAFSFPHIVVLTLPIAFLLGILVGVGRLSADSELVAVRAAGGDLAGLYRPIGVAAVVLWLATAYVMVWVVPRTNRILYSMRLQLSTFAIAQRIQPGVFTPEFAGRRIYVERASPDRKTLEGIVVSDRSSPGQGELLTIARRGALELEEKEGRLWLRLEDAVTHRTHADPAGYDRTGYRTQRILLDDTNPGGRFAQLSYEKQVREQTLAELQNRARTAPTPAEARLVRVEIQKKFALPAACLVFAFIGLPLGVVNRRGGRAGGFAVSAAIVLGYYVLIATGEARAIESATDPVVAMWLPNALLVILGTIAIARVRRDRVLFGGGGLVSLLDRFRARFARPRPAGTTDMPAARREARRSLTASWIVDRYVAARFIRTFTLVVSSILILYVLIDYLEISDDIARTHPPFRLIVAYFEAKLAPILIDVVPFSFLAAALVTVSGLVRSAETTALLAHGISLLRSVVAILLLAVLTGIGLFGLSERIVPRALTEAERLRDQLLGRPARSYDDWQAWFKGAEGRFLSAEAFDVRAGTVVQPTVFQIDPSSFRLLRYDRAPTGVLVPGRGIVMNDGWSRTFTESGSALFLRRPGPVLVNAPEASRVFRAGQADPRLMTTVELARFIDIRRQAGANVAALSTGLHQKGALAFAPLLMTLVGLPFAFKYGKKGAVAGVGIAMFLGLGYLVLSTILVKAGETGVIQPVLAAWGADVFFTLSAGHGILGIRT